MGALSIAVERIGVGIHLVRCAGDLDRDAGRYLTRLIDHTPGLAHAVVDIGNVRSYGEGALDPLHDDRIVVVGVDAHLALLPGRVAVQLAGLRSARDLDDALAQLQADDGPRTTVIREHLQHSPMIPRPRDPHSDTTGVSTPA
jgi:hypothetical protein